jgi:hypothetical protein
MPTRVTRTLSLALIAILSIALTGCSAVVDDAQAPGTYQADTDWGVSILVLDGDHLFDQTVRLKSGVTLHLKGHWKIDTHPGDHPYTTINFTPFYSVTHDRQGVYTLASSYSIYPVPFGGINIAADSDYGIAHRKQSRK